MGASATITDGFVLSDSVDAAYQRVGQAIEQGHIGQVQAHDDAAHTYTVTVMASASPAKKPGFFGRMFGRGKSDADAPGATQQQVSIAVSPSGQSGSEVRAQGSAAAVAKTVDALKAQLGG
jgi:hypothetical protein